MKQNIADVLDAVTQAFLMIASLCLAPFTTIPALIIFGFVSEEVGMNIWFPLLWIYDKFLDPVSTVDRDSWEE